MEHCSILSTCFMRLFSISQSDFRLFQFNRGKPTFIYSEHMVTIFTYHIHTSIYYNTCVKCERYINKYNNDFKIKKLIELYECEREYCLLCLFVYGTGRRSIGKRLSSVFVFKSKLSKIHILAMLTCIWQRQCSLPHVCYVYTRGMNYYSIPVCKQSRA